MLIDETRRKLTKISPVITHATGPQEIAKKAIYLSEDRKKEKTIKNNETRKLLKKRTCTQMRSTLSELVN
jgi:hypothetical protein